MKKLFFVLSSLFIFELPESFAQQKLVKEISLKENEWTNLEMIDETSLPEINLSMSFDEMALLIKAYVKDDHFRDGDRSWRYGDGFFINFVTPQKQQSDSSDKFYAFGFSMENGNPIAITVNKDGTYFPKLLWPPAPEIKIDSASMIAGYLIKIPWTNVYPFNPLKKNFAGINIVYISKNDDRSRKINMLIEDNYDTELTNFRKFIPLHFQQSAKSKLQFAFSLRSNLISSPENQINYFVYAPGKTDAEIKFVIAKEGTIITSKQSSYSFEEGFTKFVRDIFLADKPGLYTISISMNNTLNCEDKFYYVDPRFVADAKREIDSLAQIPGDANLSLGVSTLQYQLDWLENQIKTFNERKSLIEIKNGVETISSLLENYKKYKTVFSGEGYLLAVFKSNIDSSLQPFSIILPKNFDAGKPHDLIVALHGSGVDEVDFVKYQTRTFPGDNFIIVAPRGRGLSDWYVGTTEKDVVDAINNVKKVFKIDRTILYGFSMGGYGIWRFGLLYPDLFDAAIVASGIPKNLHDDKPEYDMNNFTGKEKKIPFLVMHGTEDNSLNISFTDKFIEKLKSAGYEITYERIDGAGHGNYDMKEIISNWLLKMAKN